MNRRLLPVRGSGVLGDAADLKARANVAAVAAGPVRLLHLPAVGAGDRMDRLQRLMGAAATTAAVGLTKGRNTHGFDSIGFGGGGGRSGPVQPGRPKRKLARRASPIRANLPGETNRAT
jgi:hypothetical protein